MEHYLWLIPLGFVVGAYGTLIGAGGGFVLVPILLLLYPKESPDVITSISLAVIFFNAASGSLAYTRMKRIDYKSGKFLAAATIPGAVLGAITTAFIPRRVFNVVFGVLLLGAAVVLIWTPEKKTHLGGKCIPGQLVRKLVEADGTEHVYSYNLMLGLLLSVVVGYISSLFGIGGGIVHVPALVYLLNFPVHIATATSHFILAIMAFTGTAVHIKTGAFHHGFYRTAALSLGVLAGAQLGAKLFNRFHGVWIIRCLAVALGFVGVRVLLMSV